MARKSKRSQDVIKEEVKLELTPMIDVTFLILIFFMCTLKFKTLEGKLVSYLPTDRGLSSAKAEIEKEDAEVELKVIDASEYNKPPIERTIVFRRKGSNTPFGKATGVRHDPSTGRVSGFMTEPASLFDDIAEYLKNVREASPDSKAKINSWPQVPHCYVVHILDLMMKSDFTDISYSGIPAKLMADLMTGNVK